MSEASQLLQVYTQFIKYSNLTHLVD